MARTLFQHQEIKYALATPRLSTRTRRAAAPNRRKTWRRGKSAFKGRSVARHGRFALYSPFGHVLFFCPQTRREETMPIKSSPSAQNSTRRWPVPASCWSRCPTAKVQTAREIHVLGRLAGPRRRTTGWAKIRPETLQLLELQPGHQAVTSPPRRRNSWINFDQEFCCRRRKAVEKAPRRRLDKTWTLKFAGKGSLSMPGAAVMRGVVMNHLIHHRAQLGRLFTAKRRGDPGHVRAVSRRSQFWEPPKQLRRGRPPVATNRIPSYP